MTLCKMATTQKNLKNDVISDEKSNLLPFSPKRNLIRYRGLAADAVYGLSLIPSFTTLAWRGSFMKIKCHFLCPDWADALEERKCGTVFLLSLIVFNHITFFTLFFGEGGGVGGGALMPWKFTLRHLVSDLSKGITLWSVYYSARTKYTTLKEKKTNSYCVVTRERFVAPRCVDGLLWRNALLSQFPGDKVRGKLRFNEHETQHQNI